MAAVSFSLSETTVYSSSQVFYPTFLVNTDMTFIIGNDLFDMDVQNASMISDLSEEL